MKKVSYPAFNKGKINTENNNTIILSNETDNNNNNNILPLMELSNIFVTKDDSYDEIFEDNDLNNSILFDEKGEWVTQTIDYEPILLTKDIYYKHPFCVEDRAHRNLCFPDLSNNPI
jgi:hypothetical protein